MENDDLLATSSLMRVWTLDCLGTGVHTSSRAGRGRNDRRKNRTLVVSGEARNESVQEYHVVR